MKLLTSKAIQGYRDYTKRTIAYAKYKVGSTYHKTKIESVDVTEEEFLEMNSVAEGFYYVCQLEISEREVEE